MLISRRTSWLNYKNICSTNIFTNLKVKLSVGKSSGIGLPQITTQMRANFFGYFPVSIARKDFDVSCYAHLLSSYKQIDEQLGQSYPSISIDKNGWGGRTRTYECRIQKPVPYHLATPQ